MRFLLYLFFYVWMLAGCKQQHQMGILVHTPCMPDGQEVSISGNLGLPGSSREGWIRMERLGCDLWSLMLYVSPGDTICFHLTAVDPHARPLDEYGYPMRGDICIPTGTRDTLVDEVVYGWKGQ